MTISLDLQIVQALSAKGLSSSGGSDFDADFVGPAFVAF
jgi:hypothetical protein